MSVSAQVLLDIQEDELDRVQEAFGRAAPALESKLPGLIERAFRDSPEYDSLVSGLLRVEFGLSDPRAAVESVVAAVAASVVVEVGLGTLTASAFEADFSDALSASGAEFTSVNRLGTRSAVEWLQWLLFGGTGVVVAGYKLLTRGPFTGSRTGGAVMGGMGRYSGGYSVDPLFAGTPADNWVTRVAAAVVEEFVNVVVSEVAASL